MLQVRNLTKFVEKDIYSEGCIPSTSFCTIVDVIFTAKTEKELIKKLCDFVGCEKDSIYFDEEKKDRVSLQVYETSEGFTAFKNDFDKWKKGQIELFLCDYIAKVEEIRPHTLTNNYQKM